MMTKEEALNILGATEKTLRSDLDNRYATLVKRYRTEQNNEMLEEISLAYNIVTGRYVEKPEDPPEMKKVIFGRTRKEWSNIWLYNKYKFLAVIAGTALLVYFVVTVVTNKPADFKIAAVGEFFIEESETVSDYIIGLSDGFDKVDVSSAYIGSSGDQGNLDIANEQKAMILMTVSGEDIIVVDRAIFERYAPMGAFIELDDFFAEISAYPESSPLGLIPAESGIKASESEDDVSGPEHIYGIDLNDSQLLNAIGLIGREQILTVSVKSGDPELAKELIRRIIKGSGNLLPSVTPIPPAPTPTPTEAPASGN